MFLVKFIVVVVSLLVSVAYLTIVERKWLSSIQRRRGPNVNGLYGVFQAFCDGIKLFLKESIVPNSANKLVFVASPVVTFALSLVGWCVIPGNRFSVFGDLPLGVLFSLAVSSLGVYGVMFSGWSSNNRYAFLGAVRSAAQMISYEVSIGFLLVSVVLCSSSLNYSVVVSDQEFQCSGVWYVFPLFPVFMLFLVSVLAETNRHPFDLPEAESELVSGYNVEYVGMGFGLFYLGESVNIIVMSGLVVLLFLGGGSFIGFFGSLVFGCKVFAVMSFIVWSRAAYPRYRYDQLMRLGWEIFLPFSIGWVLFLSSCVFSFDWFCLVSLCMCIVFSF